MDDSKANADMDSIMEAAIAMKQMSSEPAYAGTIASRRGKRRAVQKFDKGMHLE